MLPAQLAEVRRALAHVTGCVARGTLSAKDARYITNSLGPFNTLSRLERRYFEANGYELDLPELPSLEFLIGHLKNDRASQAVAEAKTIKQIIAPVVRRTKTTVAG